MPQQLITKWHRLSHGDLTTRCENPPQVWYAGAKLRATRRRCCLDDEEPWKTRQSSRIRPSHRHIVVVHDWPLLDNNNWKPKMKLCYITLWVRNYDVIMVTRAPFRETRLEINWRWSLIKRLRRWIYPKGKTTRTGKLDTYKPVAQIPQCLSSISHKNDALRDICLIHCGICKIGSIMPSSLMIMEILSAFLATGVTTAKTAKNNK